MKPQLQYLNQMVGRIKNKLLHGSEKKASQSALSLLIYMCKQYWRSLCVFKNVAIFLITHTDIGSVQVFYVSL